jgi:hypothetical protein
VGTANVGSCAPVCPSFIVALRERGSTVIHDRRPRSGHESDRFPDPEITFLTVCIHRPGGPARFGPVVKRDGLLWMIARGPVTQTSQLNKHKAVIA